MTGRLLRIRSIGPEGMLLKAAKLIMPAIAANVSPKKKPRSKPSRATNIVLIRILVFAVRVSPFDASLGRGLPG
jgi:hypothetical protein